MMMMFSSRTSSILAILLVAAGSNNSFVVVNCETIKIQTQQGGNGGGNVEIDIMREYNWPKGHPLNPNNVRTGNGGGIEIDIQEEDWGIELPGEPYKTNNVRTADHGNNNNKNMMFVDVQDQEDDMKDSTSCDHPDDCSHACHDVSDCCHHADDDVFMAIQLDLQVDYKFHHYGKYRLGLKDDDDDDDDSAAKLYWDIEKDDVKTGYRYIETQCVARDGCYVFNIYGDDHSFEFDADKDDINDPLGSAIISIDYGHGFKEELKIDDKFKHEHLEFGCGCDDVDDSCVSD